jgi:hypothetical protein
MNLVVAALLDVHARIAAEARGETPQPEAKWALKTEAETETNDGGQENKEDSK